VKLLIGYVSRNQTMPLPTQLLSSLIFAALLSVGCARTAATPDSAAEPVLVQPLAFMAGRPLVVLPVQHVSVSDSTDWLADPGQRAEHGELRDPARRAAYLVTLDERIAAELTERGLEKTWTFAPAIVAAARRSGTIVGDPYAISAAGLRRLVKPSDDPLGQPLASQIRSLASFRDARYVLLPVELRVENRESMRRSRLRTYLIDTRTSRIVWSGDITAASSPTLRPGVADGIATALADLAVAR